ncbi:MAG: SH3 domain-containing protein [Anaerolineae bacterium]
MRKLGLFAVLLALLLPLLVQAQSGPDLSYEVILYAENRDGGMIAGTLYVVTEMGIEETLNLPSGIFPSAQAEVSDIALSLDRRWVALSTVDPSNSYLANPVRIADLTLQTCCMQVSMNVQHPGAYSLAGFDEASSYLALSYVGTTDDPNNYLQGGLMVFDVMTNQVVQNEPLSATPIGGTWAQLFDWDSSGVSLIPSCYACDGVFESPISRWEPYTNTFTVGSEWFSIFGKTLLTTGEMLYRGLVTSLPYSQEPSMLERPNVVQYIADGLLPSTEQRGALPIVFFDPNNFDLSDDDSVDWINDGQSFLVSRATNPNWTEVSRNGGIRTFMVPSSSRVLTGTPTGWLNLEPEIGNGMTLAAYSLINGEYQRQPFGTLYGTIRVVRATPLGFSLGEAPPPFQTINAGAVAPAAPVGGAFQCDGVAVQPQLRVGGTGQVTPGLPNTIRQQPNTGSTVVGLIPPQGIFNVLQGPVCSSGFIWWQVSYNGMTGYTVEANGSDYYVVPAG